MLLHTRMPLTRCASIYRYKGNIVRPGYPHLRTKQFATTNARRFGPSADPPSLALAAGLAFGLPLTLWAYKCLLMILLQRKLIYMGYVPPGAREEDSTAYKHILRGIRLEEIQFKNEEHPCTLHGIVIQRDENPAQLSKKTRATLIYLQGNAGNPLHRIPVFKTLLHACPALELTIVAVAPRSFWKSSRRTPTEDSLLSDYRQTVEYSRTRWPTDPVVLYGHSLGASIGTCLVSQINDTGQGIRGLILENPFSSIPEMVRALYTSRWLPYHYLGPFVWDKWDVVRAASEAPTESVLWRLLRENRLLVLQSEKDEVVPLSMGRDICEAGKTGSPVIIPGALHENAWESREWGLAIRTFLQETLK